MSDETDTLMAEAILGRDAQDFFRSELGQYILGRIGQEISDAQEKLERVSPWRRRRICELQNEIWRARSMSGWLAELIEAGKAAEAALNEADAER